MAARDGHTPRVALFVSGGIAAYKACEVLRGLHKAGCEVRVAMTASATQLVGPKTFEALSGHHVTLDLFDDSETPIPHIELSEWADLALVCPATANVMAKMVAGIADDAVTSTLLAYDGPLLVAPAMNTRMWANPATQANVAALKERGALFAGPAEGRLACGDVGAGKLCPVEEVVERALAALVAEKPLVGRRVVVTAGPTHEPVDPVRYLANASSGKMGYAIARALATRGAAVTLVTGPTSLAAPVTVGVVRVTTAAEMLEATRAAFADADAAVLAAAVADYRPANPADHKLKKANELLTSIELEETSDILATLCAERGERPVIGFAAETNDLVANARAKLVRKGASLIVANDVSREDSTFGADTDRVAFVTADGCEQLPTMSKDEVAAAIAERLASLLEGAAR